MIKLLPVISQGAVLALAPAGGWPTRLAGSHRCAICCTSAVSAATCYLPPLMPRPPCGCRSAACASQSVSTHTACHCQPSVHAPCLLACTMPAGLCLPAWPLTALASPAASLSLHLTTCPARSCAPTSSLIIAPAPAPPADGQWAAGLRHLAQQLLQVDSFYDCLGGLVGYQLKSLQLIIGCPEETAAPPAAPAPPSSPLPSASHHVDHHLEQQHAGISISSSSRQQAGRGSSLSYSMPPGTDLSGEDDWAISEAAKGIEAMPLLAEIYPVGGEGAVQACRQYRQQACREEAACAAHATCSIHCAAMLCYCWHGMHPRPGRSAPARSV